MPTSLIARCAVAALALALAACTTLLDDDFEGYATGTSVGGPIPGEPDGDEIAASGDASLYVVESFSPIQGGRSLALRFADNASAAELDFVPVPPTPVAAASGPTSAQPVFIGWSGRLIAASSNSSALVVVLAGERELLRVSVGSGDILFRDGNGAQTSIGGDFSSRHRVTLRFDAGGHYAAVVSGDGSEGDDFCGGEGCQFGPLDPPVALEDIRLRMTTFLQVPQGTLYRVDGVAISQRDF